MDTIHNCFVEYIDGLVWPLRLTRIPYDNIDGTVEFVIYVPPELNWG